MNDARVLVTGSRGFLGRHLYRLLKQRVSQAGKVYGINGGTFSKGMYGQYDGADCHNAFVDLQDREDIGTFMRRAGPFDYVFHLAGYNGGIEFNRQNPADIFTRNTVMGLNLLEACVKSGVKKVVSVVASCAYPADLGPEMKFRPDPYGGVYEEYDFLGHDGPDPTVACHGFAKRNLQLASHFYRQQYDLHAVCACPTTLYGPGDSFDHARTKVMGGMVKRFVDARRQGLDSVTVWGSGRPLREFLYAPDCAELLVQTALDYDDSSLPLNLGTGQEVSVMDLAILVAGAAGYTGRILFDDGKPDGQYRKRLDLARMLGVLNELPAFTPLEAGVRKTVKWYKENYPS